MSLDHGKNDLLPKLREIPIRHLQGRLHLVDCCIPPVIWQDRKVPAQLSDRKRTVQFVGRPVGMIKQRLGISYVSRQQWLPLGNSFRDKPN